MPTDRVYLRPNVLAEPLVNQWNAYDQLIAPASAAMVMQNGHLETLQSFVDYPDFHVMNLKDPSLVGGPWVNYPVERLGEVSALLAATQDRASALLALATAIKELDELLRGETEGHSLESLYARVPAPLRGYVELVYDLNNHASIRFLEGLLYRSGYYDPKLQSFSLSLIHKDRRPFQWSTPILADGSRILAKLPFDDPSVDAIFASRTAGIDFAELKTRLGVDDSQQALLRSFVSSEPPKSRHTSVTSGVRVRYFGHACVLVESPRCSVMVDPFISYEYPTDLPRHTYQDLPPHLDFVIITHSHNDHLELETLLQLRHRVGTVIVPRANGGKIQDPSLKLLLQRIGFKRVVEADEMEEFTLPGGRILALPFLGEHCDLDIQSKRGYLVELEGKSALFAADSANVEPRLYEHLKAHTGSPTALFLGMECDGAPLSWGYGKLLTQELDRKMNASRTFSGSNCAQAMGILESLKPSQVYVYAMGEEPWYDHVMVIPNQPESKRVLEPKAFVEKCRARGLIAEKLFGMKEIHLG